MLWRCQPCTWLGSCDFCTGMGIPGKGRTGLTWTLAFPRSSDFHCQDEWKVQTTGCRDAGPVHSVACLLSEGHPQWHVQSLLSFPVSQCHLTSAPMFTVLSPNPRYQNGHTLRRPSQQAFPATGLFSGLYFLDAMFSHVFARLFMEWPYLVDMSTPGTHLRFTYSAPSTPTKYSDSLALAKRQPIMPGHLGKPQNWSQLKDKFLSSEPSLVPSRYLWRPHSYLGRKEGISGD